MKNYKYIRIQHSNFFASGLTDYRTVIDSYASEGWEYCGYFPVQSFLWQLLTVDLIFAKEIRELDLEG